MRKTFFLVVVLGVCAGAYHFMTRGGADPGRPDAESTTSVQSAPGASTELATRADVGSGASSAQGQPPNRTGRVPASSGAQEADAPGGKSGGADAPAETKQSITELIAKAKTCQAQGQLYEARNAYSDAVLGCDDAAMREECLKQLDELNKTLVFSGAPSPDAEFYTLLPGDLLVHLGKKYRIPYRLIMRMNNIRDARRVAAGRRLKVIRGPFEGMVQLGRYELYVLLRGRVVKGYAIGIGKDQSTPTGDFQVQDKLVNPTWYNPEGGVVHADDPENPLGERWIGLGGGYGIHGTNEPGTIGRSESLGCIRLKNPDAEELFDLLAIGSKVTIKP